MNKGVIVLVLVLVALALFFGVNYEGNTSNDMSIVTAQFETSAGMFTIELYESQMPTTVGNFIKLAKEGFYDGTKFHRVIEGFMIQGGDPNSKTDNEASYGTGGPGYNIVDEFAPGLSNVVGTIAMANAGPNTGGSQCFVNVADNLFLDGKHPVFGKVTDGMDVVMSRSRTPKSPRDIPLSPVVINSVKISR